MAGSLENIDQNLADSIAMLEQILEVMPHDEEALKAVYGAYQKAGQDVKAFEYLTRIIDVYTSGGNKGLLPFIREELKKFEEKYPTEAAAQFVRLHTVFNPKGTAARTKQESTAAEGRKKEADISEELALAWRLYEDDQLSQEDYSSVLHDLTEVSSKEVDVPVSVLHVLNDRGYVQINRVMNYLSSRSGVPCVSLSNFDISEEVVTALPFEVAVHDGALPFALVGNDLLVAVLNPFNHVLLDDIESESGHRCHSYLVLPEDYDSALGKLRQLAGQG